MFPMAEFAFARSRVKTVCEHCALFETTWDRQEAWCEPRLAGRRLVAKARGCRSEAWWSAGG
jgi:hypothetical protein